MPSTDDEVTETKTEKPKEDKKEVPKAEIKTEKPKEDKKEVPKAEKTKENLEQKK